MSKENKVETQEEVESSELEKEEQDVEVNEVEELQTELKNIKDQQLRMAAEFENYKKRNERDRLALLKYSGEHVLKAILPVVDNLERAISQGELDSVDAEKKHKALLEGVKLTKKSLLKSLNDFEVSSIESVGEPFDPNKHEAMTMGVSDTVPNNHIMEEFEKGYFFKDKLLRVAKVVVSSGNGESK